MKTYHIITLGCKVNSYESEAMGEILKENGYLPSPNIENNDIVIINTCSVTHVGDAKSRKMIRKAVRASQNAICVVVGCYAQLASELVSSIEGVDIVIGTRNREQIWKYIKQYLENGQPIIDVTPVRVDEKFDFLKVTSYSENTRAYLKIQDGCNNFCSYCIIPYARGGMRSRNKFEIIDEANNLAKHGYKEIVLTGIHTAGYGDDLDNYGFIDLLVDILNDVKEIERLRISSIEASQIDDKLIDLLVTNPKVVNHLHIPLQSGCDSVLKRMNRKYSTSHYLEVIEKIKQRIPDIALTTDVIVGFPGETNEEFEITRDFIVKVGFSALHVFPYSKRSGTPASRMGGQIDEKVKSSRVTNLVDLSKQLHVQYCQKFIDKKLEVLFECDNDKTDEWEGHTTNYLKVKVNSKSDLHNRIKEVKLNSINDDGSLTGTIE